MADENPTEDTNDVSPSADTDAGVDTVEADETEVTDTEVHQAADVDVDEAATPAEELLYDVPVANAFGQMVLFADADSYIDLFGELRDDGFLQVVDLCGVDYRDHVREDLPASVIPERFEVVVNLISHPRRERIRVRCQVAEGAALPSLFDLFPGTEAMERETYDMFGIEFTDHPDLSRILMPETWIGFPLRRDFDMGRIPVQFKDAPGRA